MRGFRMFLDAKAAKDDPEKLVTPGVVFCGKRIEGAAGFIIGAGWWHWCVALHCYWLTDNS